jgi:hypothetical protein
MSAIGFLLFYPLTSGEVSVVTPANPLPEYPGGVLGLMTGNTEATFIVRLLEVSMTN